jgi:hypothetical protein
MERAGIPFLKHGIPGSDYIRAGVGSPRRGPRYRSMIFAAFDHRQEVCHGSHTPGSLRIHSSDGPGRKL